MATIELTVTNSRLTDSLIRACRMLKGVKAVRLVNDDVRDDDPPITKTAGWREAMDDIRLGRIYRADNVDELFKKILE